MLAVFLCTVTWVADGDTFRCREGQTVRLAGIDAPEAGRCHPRRRCVPGDPHAARRTLVALAQGRRLRCARVGISYHRVVAWCADEASRDLSCALVRLRQAQIHRRFWQGWRCVSR